MCWTWCNFTGEGQLGSPLDFVSVFLFLIVGRRRWDYSDSRFLDMLRAAHQLTSSTPSHPTKLKAVALTNFDTIRLREILIAGVDVVSNQVSFSIVDWRPLLAMVEVAEVC